MCANANAKDSKDSPAPKPSPAMLGSGLAGGAAKALASRKSKMDLAIKQAGG